VSRSGRPGRVLALDLGARRVGVAVCDPEGLMASPYATIERSGDGREADHRAVARLVDEVGAVRVVVGLPLSMDGSRGPAAEGASREAAELRKALDVPVEELDERLSTVGASRRLSAAGLDSKRQRRGGKIDQEAAAVILESWLDARRKKS
jgi:putative holliday junction resolvase